MMQYEIVGTPFPAVVCRLAHNESMHCESNGMAWMSPNMEMDTNTGGGIGKLFGRAFPVSLCSAVLIRRVRAKG